MENVTIYDNHTKIPNSLINVELEGIYGSTITKEMSEIIRLYNIYEKGADFAVDMQENYVPSTILSKKARKLINDEASFMFSTPVDFNIKPQGNTVDIANKEETKAKLSILQDLVDNVTTKNNFTLALLKAAKDCFIGKRIAIMLNFNDDGISINFAPSLEFIYDADPNTNRLTKLVCFYTTQDDENKEKQRIYKKKYWMAEDRMCHVTEAIYNGNGELIEQIIEDDKTLFKYIPGYVILNDGLTGDLLGSSDIETIEDYESIYNKMTNSDLDAERFNMNPIRWMRDMNPNCTKELSVAPGSLWDLSSEGDADEGRTGEVGILESNMNYKDALDVTIKRIDNNMHEQLSIPNINMETMSGIITSGKGLKAIYWPLVVRSNEKMQAWKPALEFVANCIIDGALLYPNSAKYYVADPIPDIDFSVEVENNYALPEDEMEEKGNDIAEVEAKLMSKKAYMKKWRRLTDDEVDIELKQIALERQLLEDSYLIPNEGNIDEEEEEVNNNNDGKPGIEDDLGGI